MSDTKTKIDRPKMLGAGGNCLVADRLARPQVTAVVPNDHTFEDVMRPAYWANHVATFTRHPYGDVTVIREDGSMILKLIAMQASPGMVRMHPYYAFENNQNLLLQAAGDKIDEKLELPAGYKVNNIANGDKKGWRTHLPNGDLLVERKATRREAVVAAIGHAAIANEPTPLPGKDQTLTGSAPVSPEPAPV